VASRSRWCWCSRCQSPTALSAATRQHNPQVRHETAPRPPSTTLLWVINLLNLFNNYFILLWMPAILHTTGVSPSWAIFGTTAYGVGVILGALLTAPLVDGVGVERVLTCVLALGALCVLSIGLPNPSFRLLSVMICGGGVGVGGCQARLNSLSGRIYPPAIRLRSPLQ
jgi:MFS family permease